jgi:hypothetical protein
MAKMACAQCGGTKKMQKGGPSAAKMRRMDRQDKRYMRKYEKQKAEELMKSKRFKEGGINDIVGMPKYGNNPNTQEGRQVKKGGQAGLKLKKADSGMQVKPAITRPLPPNTSGVRKKYATGGATASFAPNRAVMASCKNGMVRDANGKCVMERKMAKGGATSFGMLSVKAGIDKNPKATAADRIAGAKKNARKK